MGNPFSWIYDKSGADSALGFVGNVGSGQFSKAAKQLGRGGSSLWKATPGNEIFNTFSDVGRGITGEKSWGDVLKTAKGQSGSFAWDTIGLLPGGKGVGFGFKALLGQPSKRLFRNTLRNIAGTALIGNALNLGDAVNASAATTRQPSAADKRKFEEYYNSRIAANQAANIPPIVTNQPQTPGATAAAGTAGAAGAAAGGLVGLSPEDTYQFAMQERALQKQYDDLLNELALQEQQGTLNTATSRYGIQREAAGAGQDVATQLAAAGLDFSPASAIGAEQLVQGARAQQEAAAAKNLADLIAEIQKQKTQAKGGLDISKLLLKGDIGRQRIANTIGNINSYYDMFGGA